MSQKSLSKRLELFYMGLPSNDAFLILCLLGSLVVLILGHLGLAMGMMIASIAFIFVLDFHQKTWTSKNKKIEDELAAILRNQR